MTRETDDFGEGLLMIVAVITAPIWGAVWLPAWLVGRACRYFRERSFPTPPHIEGEP